MITPPTPSYYVVRVAGEAAEYVTSMLSPGAMSDIEEAVLISQDFTHDIQATVSMDMTIELLSQHLLSDLVENSKYNSLYIPSSEADVDDLIDSEPKEDHFRFTGMDGNPFTLKMTEVTADEHPVIQGKVQCKPFDLPSYNTITAAQSKLKLQ